ncbi:MAG: hypothetical protein IJR07_11960 [Bacteroidaceae bacterium]|nr:hypothetical protein [Bacteroidaceae bacterium]
MIKIIRVVSFIVGLLSAVVMLLSAITYLVLRFYVLTPDVLMSLVKKEVSERTNVRFDCERIGLDYLTEWPSVSVVVKQGMVAVPPDDMDSDYANEALNIGFKTFGGKINLIKLITGKQLIIEDVFLEEVSAHADLSRKINLHTKTGDHRNKQMGFNINEVRFDNLNITVVDSIKSAIYHLDNMNLRLRGDLNAQHPSFNIEDFNALLSIEGDIPFANRQLMVTMNGRCQATENFHDITADGLTLLVDQFPFQLEGKVSNIAKDETPFVDLKAILMTSDLGDLIDYLPLKMPKDQYVIDGNTSCNVELSGKFGKGEMPNVKLKGNINAGSIYRKRIKQGIDAINLAFNMNYNRYMPDSCFVEISDMRLSGMDSRVYVDGRINDFTRNPFITGDLACNIDFQRVGTELFDSVDINMSGKVDSDLSFAFNLNDLKELNFHRLWAEGKLRTDNLMAQSDKYKLNLYAKDIDMSVGYKKNRSDFIEADEVLSCDAVIDTLSLLYGDTISCVISKLALRANTVLNNDSSMVTPITAHLNWNRLRGQLGSKTAIAVASGEFHAGSKAYSLNRKKMEGAAVLKADDVRLIDGKNKLAIQLSTLNLISEFQPSSASAGNELVLKNWQVKGQVDFNKASIVNSYFPQRIDISESRVGIRNNQLILSRLNVQSGNTKMLLSGALISENDSVMNTQRIEGSLRLMADNIDFDDFSSTFLSGEAMRQESTDSIAMQHSIKEMEESLTANDYSKAKKKYPIYIPANLTLDIQLDIERAIYEEAEFHQVSGNVEVDDRMARATLNMKTNLGKAEVDVVYDSRKRNQLYAIFDLNCRDVLLAQLHRVVPSVSSMFPMINSLDGIADVHLTGQSSLNSEMKSILPSAKVAGTLKGQNLTLIDNTTFDEIASKLRFKNKKRNLIDKIEVNFILNESVIEVIPFIIKWDRYEVMAGGTNNLDMMYDYHIDMLESPIPIDFGLDLTGKPKDFHYKITLKRKYKELFKDGGVELSRITAQKMEEARQVVYERMNQVLK